MAKIGSLCFCCVLMLNLLLLTTGDSAQWGGPQPKFPSRKIPDNAFYTNRSLVREKIVKYHNFFRSKVKPTASNMLKMSWHPLAAEQAQQYAEKCVFLQHNDIAERAVPKLGNCGQNIFVAGDKTPWFFAIKSWFLEYKLFSYGAANINIKDTGHYTAMVWATTHKVGCGVATCSGGPWGTFYNYVCHYCPGGNIDGIIQYPYKVGQPCSDCPGNCVQESLCDNSCSETDLFNNCAELKQVSNVCGEGYCNATCACGDKMHYNYPWSELGLPGPQPKFNLSICGITISNPAGSRYLRDPA